VDVALHQLPGAEKVEVAVPDDLEVFADRHRLVQIITNLVANAVKHGAPPIRLSAEAADSEIVIKVSDEGLGLSESLQDAFAPFSHGEGEGSVGLGLAIVRGLVEAHGGSVRYSRNQPRGACFEVRLPARKARLV
jgi:signal transduction histidine kinase